MSRPHEFLEGLENCKQCHGSDRKEIANNCLNCHDFIRTEVENESGLHGRNDYAECELCHVEHHGRDFELIYWKDGIDKFDHAETGYELTGKHKGLECRTCHNPDNIVARQSLIEAKKDLRKTYLGLDQDCASCHFDEHRAQLGSDCRKCHTTNEWKPAADFDHNTAKFSLTGKHVEVQCDKCHPTVTDVTSQQDTSYSHFTGLRFGECSACHADTHQGRLGPECTSCHNTSSWRAVSNASFDHDKTRYPLRGKHVGLACEKCHRGNKLRGKPAFEHCTACHSDFHRGDFVQDQSKGECESCHGVDGFRPARFTAARHDSSGFPLQGAHQAVPCDACHYDESSATLQQAYRFRFEKYDCQSCHQYPHSGETNEWMINGDCQSCHNQSSWASIDFNHSETDFVLVGKHQSASCRACHWNSTEKWRVEELRFKLHQQVCQDCHKDIHQGQFVTDEVTRCEHCHSPTGWNALTFDHNTQSRFSLQGAHATTPCNGCHKGEAVAEVEFVRYKPIGMACVDCHDSSAPIDSL